MTTDGGRGGGGSHETIEVTVLEFTLERSKKPILELFQNYKLDTLRSV